MNTRLLSTYYFTLECLYLYFILLLIYATNNQLPPNLAFLSTIAVANLLIYFVLRKRQVSKFIPLLSGIISGGIGYILGLTSFSAFVCVIFLVFRMEAFIKDSSLWLEERKKLPVLFYSSTLIAIFFGWIVNYSYMNRMYSILILFTILFCLGKFLQQIINQHTIKNIPSLVGSLSIATILTGLVTVILPIIKWTIIKILGGLVILVGFLSTPLFNFIEHIEIKQKPKGPEEDVVINRGFPTETESQHYLLQSIPTWTWIIILLMIVLVIMLIIRKFNHQIDIKQIEQLSFEVEYTSNPETVKNRRRLFYQPTPTQHIRKLIFQLQKYASKHKMGRQPDETLKEWLHRLNFPNHKELIDAYDFVRYGEGELNGKEKQYESDIQAIKQGIKTRDKKQD